MLVHGFPGVLWLAPAAPDDDCERWPFSQMNTQAMTKLSQAKSGSRVPETIVSTNLTITVEALMEGVHSWFWKHVKLQ
jgi:hypothetical protein